MPFKFTPPAAGGGGGATEVVPWRTIDVNDGSGWTHHVGNDNVISCVSSAAGMRVVQDIDQDGTIWTANQQTAERWYKAIQVDGVNLTWDDRFIVEFLIEVTNQTQQDTSGVLVGVCDAACTTGSANEQWSGLALYNWNNQAGTRMRIGGSVSMSDVANANGVKAYGIFLPPVDNNDPDTDPQHRRGLGMLLDSNGDILGDTASATTTEELTVGSDVYIIFAPNFYSTTGKTLDPDSTFKAWYRVLKHDDGLAPTWDYSA